MDFRYVLTYRRITKQHPCQGGTAVGHAWPAIKQRILLLARARAGTGGRSWQVDARAFCSEPAPAHARVIRLPRRGGEAPLPVRLAVTGKLPRAPAQSVPVINLTADLPRIFSDEGTTVDASAMRYRRNARV